ncbi:MAG: hypothetical protein IBX58_01360 [Roseovarius sp.]|nr:hypothetical protein [Roseovarius sp.]
MSDPVTNVDIEDVLASIRRLVSGGADQMRHAPESGAVTERLVLTPSQRIDDDERGDVPEDQAPEDQAPEDQAPKDQAPEDWPEQPTPDVSGAFDPDDMFGTQAVAEGPMTGMVEVELADAIGQEDEPVLLSETEDAPDSDAALPEDEQAAAPFAATADLWEPDGDDEDAFADGAEAPALQWRDADHDEPVPEPSSFDPDEILADEAVSAMFDGETGPQPEEAAAEIAAFALDEAVLDEDALRDLVAEIVRQELMGTLGERITRNVRKLVRREIHRALTSQDFD